MKPIDLARLFLLAALWGSSYLFLRIATPVLGIFFVVGLRIVLAACVLGVYGALTHQINFKSRWQSYLLLGLLNNAIPFLLIAIAVIYLNASIAAILNATTPLFTAIVSALWLKEPLTKRKVMGLLLGVVGVAVLVGWNPLVRSYQVLLGIVSALIAAFAYALGAVYVRYQFRQNRPTEIATGQLIGSSILLMPLTVATVPKIMPSLEVIVAVVLLAIACTTFAYLLYFQLIANAGATQAATVTFLVPVFSLLFGVVFLGEPVNSGLIIGMIIILLSIRLSLGTTK